VIAPVPSILRPPEPWLLTYLVAEEGGLTRVCCFRTWMK